jgi:hypothetical protein
LLHDQRYKAALREFIGGCQPGWTGSNDYANPVFGVALSPIFFATLNVNDVAIEIRWGLLQTPPAPS